MPNFIIIANGNFLIKEIICEAIIDKTIIALDGAVNKLIHLGVHPHIILGDFDSIEERARHHFGVKNTFSSLQETDSPYTGQHGTTIIPAKNQLFTDLSKAIHFCDQQGAESITIICATGGRLDHHESALRSLRAEYKKDRPILLHTEQQTLRFAKDETIRLKGEIGDKCGIVAYPHGWMTSKGLEYEANNFELQLGFSENTCNALLTTQATTTITGEALVIMPPQLFTQREFMRKNEAERLTLLLRDAKLF
jgi:thiamine pyrophosphokinase